MCSLNIINLVHSGSEEAPEATAAPIGKVRKVRETIASFLGLLHLQFDHLYTKHWNWHYTASDQKLVL